MIRFAPFRIAAFAALMLLASGCQRAADTPSQTSADAEKVGPAEARHDDLQKAIETPLDKAKAIEQPLLDSQHKTDQALDAADKNDDSDQGS